MGQFIIYLFGNKGQLSKMKEETRFYDMDWILRYGFAVHDSQN